VQLPQFIQSNYLKVSYLGLAARVRGVPVAWEYDRQDTVKEKTRPNSWHGARSKHLIV